MARFWALVNVQAGQNLHIYTPAWSWTMKDVRAGKHGPGLMKVEAGQTEYTPKKSLTIRAVQAGQN